jgi:cytochrome c553
MRARRIALIIVAGSALLVALVVGVVYAATELRFSRSYPVSIPQIVVSRDAATVEYGSHVALVRGCTSCHGTDLGGSVMHDDPLLARLVAPNLTAGAGGVGQRYREADYDRAMRHGVRPDGRPMIFHPAHEFHGMSDEDASAVIAYIGSLPPVDRSLPPTSVGPVLRFIFLVDDGLVLVPAERIDHRAQRPAAPAREESVAYGKYLATTCTGCHGVGFSGGAIPGAPPDATPGTNLTPSGRIGTWSRDEFVRTMRTGRRPDGYAIDPKDMPWPQLGEMTDVELGAVYLYLTSLPPLPTGRR